MDKGFNIVEWEKPNCTTTRCVAGWYIHHKRPRDLKLKFTFPNCPEPVYKLGTPEEITNLRGLSKYFDISLIDAEHIFLPISYGWSFGDVISRSGRQPTRRQIVSHIKKVIKNNSKYDPKE